MTVRADLPQVNDALFTEFRRITGQSNRFLFASWLATQARAVGYGETRRLLDHLQTLPSNSQPLGAL